MHPTLIHVVRKGKGNTRHGDLEPVPNKRHWTLEFVVKKGMVYMMNKTSQLDDVRKLNQ